MSTAVTEMRRLMTYRRFRQAGAYLGLVAAALAGSAATHDNITGFWLLVYPVGLSVGMWSAHVLAIHFHLPGSNGHP